MDYSVTIEPIQPIQPISNKRFHKLEYNLNSTNLLTNPPNNSPSYSQSQSHSQSYQPDKQSRFYPDSSPIIHTSHSEWIDSPIVSPSPTKMSTTATITQEKFETPIRSKIQLYITPITNGKNKTDEKIQDHLDNLREHEPPPTNNEIVGNNKPIAVLDIFWSMINSITGKDKMAKVGQYLLRLLIYHANQTRDYLSDDIINIKAIDTRYNDRDKKLNLIRNFLKHPFDFAKIVIILFCSRFTNRFKGVVNGLSMYRQFLRFGKTPFRIRDLYKKLETTTNHGNVNDLLTKKTLSECIGLYYGFNDECLLLFKLGVLTNKKFKRFVARHESLAWYYDSILGIYSAVGNINTLTQQEMDLKIQIQVKNKARMLSKQILGSGSGSGSGSASTNSNSNSGNILINYYHENSSNSDIKTLKQIQFKKFNAYLDFFKWISDFIFDSYTVFKIKLPFKTLQIWFGLLASCLSTLKIYRETKLKLQTGTKK